MGQYWMLVNLDNKQYCSFGKLGKVFYGFIGPITGSLLRSQSDNKNSWTGHRLICIGDYIKDYPPGILSSEELEMFAGDKFSDCLFDFVSANWSRCNWLRSPTNEASYILRNLSKREYVRGDALAVKSEQKHTAPGLTEAVLCRISWSTDPSAAMPYEPKWPGICPLTRGPWAGDRFDVVKSTEFDREGKEWSDVSEDIAKELFSIWSDEYGPAYGNAWRNKYYSFFSFPPILIPRPRYSQSIDIKSPFPSIPIDILRVIFDILIAQDEALALDLVHLSKAIQGWITPIIYKNAIVPELQVKKFQWTMESSNGRELGKLVRLLYLGVGTGHHRTFTFEELNESLPSILSACTDLESFSTNWSLLELENDSLATMDGLSGSFPSPKYIIFDNGESSNFPPSRHPLLHNVTHLCINFEDLSKITPDVLPNLINLAVHGSLNLWIKFDHFALVNNVLRSFPNLKSFVVLSYLSGMLPKISFEDEFWQEIVVIEDPRLIVRSGLDVEDYRAIMQGKAEKIWDETVMCTDWRDRCLQVIWRRKERAKRIK